MRWFLILLLSVVALSAQTFTEFYCDASVSANNTNVNAGSTTGAPVYGPSVNGNWDGTSVFTPTDGSTPASTVSAGMWASVYLDAATVAVYIAQVTNVAAGANGAITLSQAAFAGTKPASGVNGRTIRVGGCWKGPFGSVGFPFGFIAQTATNFTSQIPRVNMKSAPVFQITTAVSHGNVGPVWFQGYTSSPGDGGKFTISGGGSAINMIVASAAGFGIQDCIISNSSTSVSAGGLFLNGVGSIARRCIFRDLGVNGVSAGGGSCIVDECEAFNCDRSNTAEAGGFKGSSGATFINCYSHDNVGSGCGFVFDSGAGGNNTINCIAANNNRSGFYVRGSTSLAVNFKNCDSYANGGSGFEIFSTGAQTIYSLKNCNSIGNAVWGIVDTNGPIRLGEILYCYFGSGTQANAAGDIKVGTAYIEGTNSYAANVTPWVNPANGNFTINLAEAKSVGRNVFVETTVNSPTNTQAWIDMGAAQSSTTNASGGSWTFSQ